MQYKIVADSSSNIRTFDGIDFAGVPLKIITKEKEYVDTPDLDLEQMVADLKAYKGTSGTSCPNVYEWLEAFGDADCVFAIAITSNLSGSCNAARQAAEDYMAANPGRRVCVIDSLSAGPELRLIAEKVREGVLAGKSFDEIKADTRAYMQHTHLLFTLRSLENLARNGRVSPAVAKIASVLGICIVGKASDVGTLEPLHKCRGEKSALKTLYKTMKELGFAGGKVRISHCLNPKGAQMVVDMIRAEFPAADVIVDCAKGLVCYYAEKGGMLVQAHPFRRGINVLQNLDYLDGVEANSHPLYDATHVQKLTEIAHSRKLILTSGGDYHADTPRPHCGAYLPDDLKDTRDLKNFLMTTDSLEIEYQEPGESVSHRVTYRRG